MKGDHFRCFHRQGRTGRVLKLPPSGGWKAARTRTLESVRYVAQPFQAAGSRSFPAPQRAPARVGPWWEYQDAPDPEGASNKDSLSTGEPLNIDPDHQ